MLAISELIILCIVKVKNKNECKTDLICIDVQVVNEEKLNGKCHLLDFDELTFVKLVTQNRK